MSRIRYRATLEQGPSFNINTLIREGRIKPGELKGFTVTYLDGTKVTLVADMRPERASPLIVIECEVGRQEIALLSIPVHFGGRKWFFRCPRTYKRVSVLHKPLGSSYFASRKHYGRQVAYKSQFYGKLDLEIYRHRSLRRRLGGSDDLFEDFPDKPKGMHWRIYGVLKQRDEAFREKVMANAEKMLFRI
jgi:hypothetical protein